MDLSEMIASPPPRPAASRAPSEGIDQAQDSAFAAAVDAADAADSKSAGKPEDQGGETPPSKGQDGETPKVGSDAGAPVSETENAPVDTTVKGADSGITKTARIMEQPALPVAATSETPGRSAEKSGDQPVRIATKSSVAAGDTRGAALPAGARNFVRGQVAGEVSSTDMKATSPSETSTERKAIATEPSIRSGSDSKPVKTPLAVKDGPEAARTTAKVQPNQTAAIKTSERNDDIKVRRSSSKPTGSTDPEFRVIVRNTTQSAAKAEPGVKTEPTVAAAPVRPDASRNVQRASKLADRVQARDLNAEAATENPKLQAELKTAPELPGPTRLAAGETLVRTTSTMTTVQSLSLAPAQAAQLQTASLPTMVAAEHSTPGFVEARLAPQLTAAAGTRSNGGVVEVLLEPPELGRVEIQMELSDQGLRATLSAERQATTDLLRRNLEVLAQQFEDAGFADVDLDFASFGDGQLATEQEDTAGGEHLQNTDEDANRSHSSRSASSSGHDGLVDMRL